MDYVAAMVKVGITYTGMVSNDFRVDDCMIITMVRSNSRFPTLGNLIKTSKFEGGYSELTAVNC